MIFSSLDKGIIKYVETEKLSPVKSVTLVFFEKFNRASSYWLLVIRGQKCIGHGAKGIGYSELRVCEFRVVGCKLKKFKELKKLKGSGSKGRPINECEFSDNRYIDLG